MPAAEPDSVQTLLARAWTLRYAAPQRLAEVVPKLVQAAGTDPQVLGMATVFDAHQALAVRDLGRLEDDLAAADRQLAPCGPCDGTAARLELISTVHARRAEYDAALTALAPALDWLDTALSPPVSYAVLQRQGLILERLGRFDDALRVDYRAISVARHSGLPALVATVLGAVGGLQSSILNLDDALPLCEEAWWLCEAQAWPLLHSNVGTNRLMVLSWLGRHAEAVALARRLLAIDAELPPHNRSQRLFLAAQALARAGQVDSAQACLDRGREVLAHGAPPHAEWAWTQASVFNQRGEPAAALRTVRDYATSDAPAHYGSDYPIDTAQLCSEAARACEALQDFETALRYERQAAAARATTQRQASHARRLTLQIEYELDAAHRQRDAALHEQARLADLNAALKSADEAKTRFLAAASHDLRQPVHALALQTAALRHELNAPRQFEMLASIERCAGSLSTMFDTLLDLSRMDAGALVPQRGHVDLTNLLLGLVEEHEPAAQAKGLRLALRIAGAGMAATNSDPGMLETLLRNLIVNAIKYTERGAVLIGARRGHDAAGTPQWRLQVWDTGIGIGESDAERIYDEFFQVGNPARLRAQGLGLGLAIVQRLARLLGHPLAMRSVTGRGSCFELRVPLASDAPRVVLRGTATPDLRGLHVAVIEDDPEVRAAMCNLLSQWGCRVSAGDSAAAVLGAIAKGALPAPQAVLADFRLPGPRSGAQETEQLRASFGGLVPALILTGDLTQDTLAQLARLQQPWLPKPVQVQQLATWLLDVAAGARPS